MHSLRTVLLCNHLAYPRRVLALRGSDISPGTVDVLAFSSAHIHCRIQVSLVCHLNRICGKLVIFRGHRQHDGYLRVEHISGQLWGNEKYCCLLESRALIETKFNSIARCIIKKREEFAIFGHSLQALHGTFPLHMKRLLGISRLKKLANTMERVCQ